MFKIYSPSFKRPKQKTSHNLLSELIYVVCETEKEAYLESKEHDKFWFVPKGVQGNLCRVRNYILDNSEEKNILLIDDDHTKFAAWINNQRTTLDENETMNFFSDMFDMCETNNIHFWGVLPNNDNLSYREITPFSLSSYIGGPIQGFCNCDMRYDESLPLKEDYDMTLQILNKYRIALRANYFVYYPKQHTNKGGCASYRTTKKEIEQAERLKKKWGSKIIKDGGSHKIGKTTEKSIQLDINPIIKVPIKGI